MVTRRVTIRRVLVALVALAAAPWLFSDTFARYRSASREGDGRLRFAYWGGYDDHLMWGKIVEAFHAAEPSIRIKREWLPLWGYVTKLDQQFLADEAPDIMMFQDEPFPRYAPEQFADIEPFLAADPLTRLWLDDCWPTAAASFQFAGRLRGMPIMGGNVLIYCNLDGLELAEKVRGQAIRIPKGGWTLEEFLELCRRLTIDVDGDGRTDQFGLLQPHWVYYLPLLWSHGADLMDESRSRWTLQGPAAGAAFQTYADLRHRWAVSPVPIQYAGQNSDTAFLSGRVCMCLNGPWFQAFLRETRLRDRYAVLQIPAGPGGSTTRVTWDALCIYAKSPPKRQADAWRFLRFVLSVESQSVVAAHQRAIPARRSAAEAFVQFGGGPDSPSAEFIEAMGSARLQPITPAWMAIGRSMSRAMNSLILDGPGRKSPEQALAELASDPVVIHSFGASP